MQQFAFNFLSLSLRLLRQTVDTELFSKTIGKCNSQVATHFRLAFNFFGAPVLAHVIVYRFTNACKFMRGGM